MPEAPRTDLPPDQVQLADEVTELDNELMALKARFDQYFLGLEKKNPQKDAEALKKRILNVRGQFIRNTALKFRVGSLMSKFQTYERLWAKTLQEMESGTYRRDIFRLRRKLKDAGANQKPAGLKTVKKPQATDDDFDIDEDSLDAADEPAPSPSPVAPPAARSPVPAAAVAAKAPVTATAVKPPMPAVPAKPAAPAAPAAKAAAPAAAQPKAAVPAKPASSGELPMDKIKKIYTAYVAAKKQCNESTEGLTLEAVAHSLRKQVPKLIDEYKAKSVDFKIVIKDGRAVLKAVPNK